jgi:transcriptional regulator with XRE-family HTH domain
MMITELIGKRIKELRLSNTGLSQEKFANEIGMDRTYFAGVESGKRNISVKNLEKIILGLNVTFSVFFTGLED